MARIDYWNIEQQIASIIKTAVPRARVLVEEELDFGESDVVGIYLEDRTAADNMQSISSGTRMRVGIQFTIWCWHFGFGKNQAVAMQQRDILVGDVETALMAAPTLNNTVTTSWITGGEFLAGPEPSNNGFAAGATVNLLVDATATI